MVCCPECFGDRGLRRNIFPLRSEEIGICSYCASENVPLIVPTWLAEYFQLLQSAYQQSDGGQPLVHWCRQDWRMFAHTNMDNVRANDLLTTILEDGDVATRTLLPVEVNQQDRLVEWQKLREELMFQNRFFPSSNIDLDRLELLLSHLSIGADEVPTLWYRARIQNGDLPFTIDQMGAPPQGRPHMVAQIRRVSRIFIWLRTNELRLPRFGRTRAKLPASPTSRQPNSNWSTCVGPDAWCHRFFSRTQWKSVGCEAIFRFSKDWGTN